MGIGIRNEICNGRSEKTDKHFCRAQYIHDIDTERIQRCAKTCRRERKRAEKRACGAGWETGTQRQLVDSSVRVLQELTLLTDIEYGLTGRQIDKDLYEWVMESSGDSRSVMVGNVEGEGIFTLHSHLNKIGFGITVKNEMGVLHSGYDVDEFGDPLCRSTNLMSF